MSAFSTAMFAHARRVRSSDLLRRKGLTGRHSVPISDNATTLPPTSERFTVQAHSDLMRYFTPDGTYWNTDKPLHGRPIALGHYTVTLFDWSTPPFEVRLAKAVSVRRYVTLCAAVRAMATTDTYPAHASKDCHSVPTFIPSSIRPVICVTFDKAESVRVKAPELRKSKTGKTYTTQRMLWVERVTKRKATRRIGTHGSRLIDLYNGDRVNAFLSRKDCKLIQVKRGWKQAQAAAARIASMNVKLAALQDGSLKLA